MTKLRPTILYLCVDPSMGGSTASLYNLIEGLKDNISPIVLFSAYGDGYDYFSNQGIESYVYPFIRLHEFKSNRLIDVWKHPWQWHYIKKIRFDYGCCRYVKRILAGRQVDIVHTNTSPIDVGVILSRKFNAKHIWHVREMLGPNCHFDVYGGVAKIRKKINNADARIAISSAIRDYWQMPRKDSFVINDAVRSKSDAIYTPVKEKYLLFCSYYLTEPKGTRKTIEAFAKSGVANEGYTLKLVGNCDAEYMIALEETAQKYKVREAIEFIPCQRDVRPFFEHATAYIMASENEGLGRVTAEAMFFGCPVIAHASGGTLDMVKQNETGYLYNIIDECAALIKQVCEEPQEELILRAQKYAVNNLSQEVYGPKIMEVYRTILNN